MSLEPVAIYKGQDFYVPTFEIKIGPSPLKRGVVRDIIQVTYTDNLEQFDRFEITINNWDAEKGAFKYSDQTLFDPGQKVEVWMGYYGKERLRRMLTGTIEELRPTFPASGQPTLAISGFNLLYDLRNVQQTDHYREMTDSQIAKRIAGRLGVEIETKELANETEYEHLFQDNKFDIIFLLERARRIGYDLYVKEQESQNGAGEQPTLVFGPSTERAVAYELTYGQSLIQFTPTLSAADQVSEVIVRGWDTRKKKKIEKTANRRELKTKEVGSADGSSGIEQAFKQRKEIIVDKSVESEAEAKELAIETLQRIAKEQMTGSGSTVGLPDLRTGSVIEIGGVGTRFSGRYFVTSTTHTIGDSGYTTQFVCRREEK